MKQSKAMMLALLSILVLVTTSTLAIAEEHSAHAVGSVEVRVTGTDVKDNPARVNEYTPYTSDEGLNPSTKINLEVEDQGYLIDLESAVNGSNDQEHSVDVDLKRIFRLDFNYSEFQHWKDHETLDQMGATARDDIAGGQPNVTTDKIYAELIELTGNPAVSVGGQSLSADGSYDPAAAYQQEVSNEYLITRKEYKGETDLALPFAPNVVIHAGMRVEKREGMEQAIGLDKCTSCHVSAVGKNINERTEDFTLGATGKFGIVTVDYEYLNREFAERAGTAERYYTTTGHANSYQLLYGTNTTESGDLGISKTPDSEKDSHSLRARADFSNSTSATVSYVKSNIESTKDDQPEYDLLSGNTLETEYESFGGKVSTKIGDVRLSLRGSTYEIEADQNEIYFPARDNATAQAALLTRDVSDEYVTAEEREVKELGIDAVYRLTSGTTLRLGYEYQDIDREEDELGNTEINTLKAAVKSRINNSLSGRVSYMYQDIDEPLAGADVGIAQGDTLATEGLGGVWYYSFPNPPTDGTNDGNDWYWNIVYPNRQLSSSNQPDKVHEAKATATWTINPNMAATLFARVRTEENDAVKYAQDTYVPGVTFWYAPNGKMNLTMAYTFNKQETENQMCVGWYHG